MENQEFPHDRSLSVSPLVRRLTAPNPSVFTGPGTNTYIIGNNADLTVIDPGPNIQSHIDNLVAETGGKINSIVATHTHPDHSPAVAPLCQATGAKVYGMHASTIQDDTFKPDQVLTDGQILRASDHTIRCIHTPGHASNHFCLLLQEENLLFTGDHIMQGSTVVISPPDGDMDAYLASLERLSSFDINALAPAHGSVITEPDKTIKGLIRHRLNREFKSLNALKTHTPIGLDELVPFVYNDVDSRLHPIAKQSLLAHLERLQKQGKAQESEGIWSVC